MPFPLAATLIDNFDRADSASLGSNWTELGAGGATHGITSNQVYRSAGMQPISMYNVAQFGPDFEVYATIAVFPPLSGGALAVGVTNSSYNGYLIQILNSSGTQQITIQRLDGGVATLVGSTYTPTVSDGDLLGLQRIGSTVYLWLYHGGSWSELSGGQSGSSYLVAINPVLSIFTGAGRLDNFYAGTIRSLLFNDRQRRFQTLIVR